ncbi:dephospho-CoA kinase [Egibacter rhizosphaerae]|uniref:Dephospho-CoA kinase n=1 Tax=Egibacter rhizosphaerae TaxID=1670831 RepID=A0A411YKS2_9ACTN|nr:dephospho-CoA kinase [Egibacter rhizosphaerae]QBI21786.1 dephospho-CoA kinase [Egibacter rhizosphaerae]
MYLVGLTGGIAAGKSTVAERLCEHGAELIDADQIAREVVLPGEPAYQRVVEHFGEEILDDAGFIDRERLGAIVFGSPGQRAALNELTHPPILRTIADRLEILAHYGGLVVVDIALLVEMNTPLPFDAVVVVAAREGTQQDRLVTHRGLEPDDAHDRIASQAPLEEKLEAATHVIWNEGSLEALRERTDEVAEQLKAGAAEKAARAGDIPDE